jgi:hypothetical protein
VESQISSCDCPNPAQRAEFGKSVNFDTVLRSIGPSLCAIDPQYPSVGTVRRNPLVDQKDLMPSSKQEHNLFSVMGQKLAGHATALIIAAMEADAQYYALHELDFVTLSETMLVSDSVYIVIGYPIDSARN